VQLKVLGIPLWTVGMTIPVAVVIISIVYAYQRRGKAEVVEFELEDKFESKILIERVKSREKRKILYVVAAASLILLTGFALTKMPLDFLRRIPIFEIGIATLIVIIVALIVYFISHRREKARVVDFELENYRNDHKYISS
jgi:Na+-transporting methylmalonyl-CoA/oxaloacetate decarboxylase gamma subunit